MSKRAFTLLAVLGVSLFSPMATAQEAPKWEVSARFVFAAPSTSGDSGDSLGPASGIGGGIGLAYRFVPNLSFEIAGARTTHDTDLTPAGVPASDAGSLGVWSGTGMLHYHFLDSGKLDIRAGAGAAFLSFSGLEGERLTDYGIRRVTVENKIGFVLGAGASYQVSDSLALGMDLRYLRVSTESRAVFRDGTESAPSDLTFSTLQVGASVALRF